MNKLVVIITVIFLFGCAENSPPESILRQLLEENVKDYYSNWLSPYSRLENLKVDELKICDISEKQIDKISDNPWWRVKWSYSTTYELVSRRETEKVTKKSSDCKSTATITKDEFGEWVVVRASIKE